MPFKIHTGGPAPPGPQAQSGQAGARFRLCSQPLQNLCAKSKSGDPETTKSPCTVAICATQLTRQQNSSRGHTPEPIQLPAGQVGTRNHSCSVASPTLFPRDKVSLWHLHHWLEPDHTDPRKGVACALRAPVLTQPHCLVTNWPVPPHVLPWPNATVDLQPSL